MLKKAEGVLNEVDKATRVALVSKQLVKKPIYKFITIGNVTLEARKQNSESSGIEIKEDILKYVLEIHVINVVISKL